MKQSLFDAVGVLLALQHVLKVFYDKGYAHDWLKLFFTGHDQQAIEKRQTEFMGEKMGASKVSSNFPAICWHVGTGPGFFRLSKVSRPQIFNLKCAL